MTNNFFFYKNILKNILGKFFFFSKKYFGIIFLEKIIWKLNFANCNFGKTFLCKMLFRIWEFPNRENDLFWGSRFLTKRVKKGVKKGVILGVQKRSFWG